MNKKLIFGLITSLVIAHFYFLQPFLNDYFLYKDVVNTNTVSKCNEYYSTYPEGYFKKDVRFIEIKLSRDIDKVRSYIYDYKKDENENNYKIVKEIRSNLWDDQISKYESSVKKSKGDPKAISFFREILGNMKKNDSTDIFVKFNSDIKLKELNDYGNESIKILNLLYTKNLVSKNNTIQIKPSFTSGNVQELEKLVRNGIKTSLERVFNNKFVNILPFDNSNHSNKPLVISVSYSIRNQEEDLTRILHKKLLIPELWIYHQNNAFKNYVLGISIDFKFNFPSPESVSKYQFDLTVDPSKEKNIPVSSIQDGYSKMTSIIFTQYSNKIIGKFGII